MQVDDGFITVSNDTSFEIGELQKPNLNMNLTSHRLEHMRFNIFTAVKKLIMFFG
jgi:hypothetical protein